ncbi:MAG: dihydroorotase, partial [Verrucomicrobiales bacterium VVV1]
LVVKRYSAEPRRMMGLPAVPVEEGKPADFILFDPEAETTFTTAFMKSKSRNTPFLDKTLKGRVDLVVLGDAVLLER